MSGSALSSSVAWLLLVGLVFHLVYIGTVFDCYFTSPVVHGMLHHSTSRALSKRLVLIVGDGLRADMLFGIDAFNFVPDAPKVVAPYLRSIVETRGAWGISHTHVPTESRPGHVAIIAGMYEDVSAVTKGWKTNPVDFDSVFNQSSHTFSFGSPDILPMFSRGATPGKVRTWCYEEHDEDFTKDATSLDTWVLEHVRQLFHNATADPLLDSQLRSEKVVFFLHLLGLDTTGHAYRPHSKEYMANIQVVDTIVRQTESLFAQFYGDEETSFVFTADHGMSRIGNHGDGDPDNTRTPVVAWGKGVRGPVSIPQAAQDSYSAPFQLSHVLRQDMEQADITPLMATLLGIGWPVNSVGVLPDVDTDAKGYLRWDKDGDGRGEERRTEAAVVNAKVVLEHYRVKHDMKRAHTLFYKPFGALSSHASDSDLPGSQAIKEIEALIQTQGYIPARQKSFELINVTLEGLRYLQTYDRTLIRYLVVLAYTGWAAYAAAFIVLPRPPHSYPILTIIALTTLLGSWSLFALQKSPWTFYIYVMFPCYFWHGIGSRGIVAWLNWLRSGRRVKYAEVANVFLRGFLVMVALGCMVRAYTVRYIWSIGFLLMGVVWPQLSWPSQLHRSKPALKWAWTASCLLTGVFPMLGVEKKENLLIILCGGFCMMVFGLQVARLVCETKGSGVGKARMALYVQIALIGGTMAITTSSVYRLQAKSGLPLSNQIAGWIALIVSTLYPFISGIKHSNPSSKLLTLFLAFCPCFVILSISVEGLFYLSYSLTLGLWIEVESALRLPSLETKSKMAEPEVNAGVVKSVDKTYEPSPDDLRIALFFLFFVQVGFFGTGNVASISSFYLEPVYRLMPIFRPFLMAALLVFKIVAPYVILSATFATINARLQLPPFSLFLVALTLTDGMTVTFFFHVTDTGSWLEIGQSISFFCITSLLLVWSAGICAAGEVLMGDVLRNVRYAREKVA